MNMKGLAAISGLLVLLALGALGVNQWMSDSSSSERVGQPLMPTLDMARAGKIVIESHEGRVTLNAGDQNSWTVGEQNNFPVAPKKLNGLLFKLTRGKISHLITSKPEKLGNLGLLKPEENGGEREEEKTGVLIRIVGRDQQTMYELMVGNQRQGTSQKTFGGTYVRFPEDSKAYIVSESIVNDFNPKDWIDNVVFDVEGNKTIKSIRVEKPGQPPLNMTRSQPETDWVVEGLQSEQVNQDEVKSLMNQLAGLDVFTIAKAGLKPTALGRKQIGSVRFEFFDQRAYTMTVGMEKAEDDFRYLTLQAALPSDVQDEALKTKVDDFNKRYTGLMMGIYDWDGGRLLRERKELIAKKDS